MPNSTLTTTIITKQITSVDDSTAFMIIDKAAWLTWLLAWLGLGPWAQRKSQEGGGGGGIQKNGKGRKGKRKRRRRRFILKQVKIKTIDQRKQSNLKLMY